MHPKKLVASLCVLAALLAACGDDGGAEDEAHGHATLGSPADPSAADRTIDVVARDPAIFGPEEIEVDEGETILFRITNEGRMPHEFVLGGEGHVHGEADAASVHVSPGATEELAWTFTETGHTEFACFVPGHYEAGMKGSITVASD